MLEEKSVSEDFLQDIENEISAEPASVGARFWNFVIDYIVFYVLYIIMMGSYGLYLALSNNVEAINNLQETETLTGNTFTDALLGMAIYVAIMTLIEGVSKGRSIGKLITKTKVVKNEDASSITFKEAFLRSLCRIVPFEVLSGFGGYPWHDRWTNTAVIKIKK